MRLSFDMFSGRTNPAWQFHPMVSRSVFEVIADLGLLPSGPPTSFPARLGYRGLRLALPTEIVQRYRVAPNLIIPAPSPIDHADMIRALAAIAEVFRFVGYDEFTRIARMLLEWLARLGPGGGGAGRSGGAAPMGPCPFEMLPYDPGPWNDAAHRPTNNCYAYATNKLATYARKPQPGVASGRIYDSLSGADVAAAAKRDGAHDVGDCFGDAEAPRMLVALVIWPGADYHWYRKHPDCWGHKPGGTDARNVDSSGRVITDPQTCDRGPYTEFHGYMLIPKSQRVAAP